MKQGGTKLPVFRMTAAHAQMGKPGAQHQDLTRGAAAQPGSPSGWDVQAEGACCVSLRCASHVVLRYDPLPPDSWMDERGFEHTGMLSARLQYMAIGLHVQAAISQFAQRVARLCCVPTRGMHSRAPHRKETLLALLVMAR